MSQQQIATVSELRERNEIVINKHIAALNSVGGALQQFLEVLTSNAILQSRAEAAEAKVKELEERLAALAPKAVEASADGVAAH